MSESIHAAFSALPAGNPDQRAVLDAMASWVAERGGKGFLRIPDLLSIMGDAEPAAAMIAVDAVTAARLAATKHRVVDPHGVLLDPLYDSPFDIPDEIESSFGRIQFDRGRMTVVVGLWFQVPAHPPALQKG